MSLRLKIAACVLLLVVWGLLASAACTAMNEADDVSLVVGLVGLLASFVLLPWGFSKILRWKGKVNA